MKQFRSEKKHNMYTITIIAKSERKVITVGDYEKTKQAFMRLKKYKKELAFK
jgi:hypothetical protein